MGFLACLHTVHLLFCEQCRLLRDSWLLLSSRAGIVTQDLRVCLILTAQPSGNRDAEVPSESRASVAISEQLAGRAQEEPEAACPGAHKPARCQLGQGPGRRRCSSSLSWSGSGFVVGQDGV